MEKILELCEFKIHPLLSVIVFVMLVQVWVLETEPPVTDCGVIQRDVISQ